MTQRYVDMFGEWHKKKNKIQKWHELIIGEISSDEDIKKLIDVEAKCGICKKPIYNDEHAWSECINHQTKKKKINKPPPKSTEQQSNETRKPTTKKCERCGIVSKNHDQFYCALKP